MHMERSGRRRPALRTSRPIAALAAVFLSGLVASAEEKQQTYTIVEETVSLPYQVALRKLDAAIKAANLLVIGEPDYRTMQQMVGKSIRGAKGYFLFRPDLGIPVFENDYRASLEIPMKLLIFDDGGGKTVIRYVKPSSAMAHYSGAPLRELGQKLDATLAAIIDGVKK